MHISGSELFYKMGYQSKDGYFIYNASQASFNYFNDAFSAIVNFSRLQIESTPQLLLSIVHPEDRLHAENCFNECIKQQVAKKYEIKLFINKIEKFIKFSAFPLIENGENIICCIAEDITVDRHNQIHIEQINAHKNITLEVLSHDLKEPLAMIRLAASAVEKEAETIGNQTMINSLSFIKEMCERNLRLVRGMINKEFVKSSVVALKKERTEIVWELEDLLRFYRRSHLREIKDFRFKTSHKKIHLMLDTMKFMQVINNLISNAIKFTPTNGIIELEVIDKDDAVMVTLADNGIGISEELKPNLFEIESKHLKLGLTGENSGGLGMNIIKTIVELHGGEIDFESERGKGSKFFIELPKE